MTGLPSLASSTFSATTSYTITGSGATATLTKRITAVLTDIANDLATDEDIVGGFVYKESALVQVGYIFVYTLNNVGTKYLGLLALQKADPTLIDGPAFDALTWTGVLPDGYTVVFYTARTDSDPAVSTFVGDTTGWSGYLLNADESSLASGVATIVAD